MIGQDIDTLNKITNKSHKLRDILESGDFCNSLGYNHAPYAWLETLCDEMIEDKIGE